MKKNITHTLSIAFLLFLLPFIALSQNKYQHFVALKWEGVKTLDVFEKEKLTVLSFEEGIFPQLKSRVSVFHEYLEIADNEEVVKVEMLHPIYKPLTKEELMVVKDLEIDTKINIKISHMRSRNSRVAEINFFPLVKQNGQILKLTQVSLKPIVKEIGIEKSTTKYASNSVLSTGDWYKIRIKEDGIYKLTYGQLKDWGVDVENMDIHKMGVFGNTGMILPQMNKSSVIDDLAENPMHIEDGGDGKFNSGDYIAFYGKAPTFWKLNSDSTMFNHVINPYNDYSYYFFTPNAGSGKRLETTATTNAPATYVSETFDDYQYHEEELENLIKSGRNWFGEKMIASNKYQEFMFEFGHVVPNSEMKIESRVAAHSETYSKILVFVNDEKIYEHGIQSSSGTHYRAKTSQKDGVFTGDGFSYAVKFEYNTSDHNADAWIDWVEILAKSNIYYDDEPLFFRDKNSIGEDAITTFKIKNARNGMLVWDITQPTNPKNITYQINSNQIEFTTQTPELKQFVAFELKRLKAPKFIEKIQNQNLHGLSDIDYVIVAPDIFREQAIRVSELHKEYDDLNSVVVSPEVIYNEFSSGGQDVSGLRNFFRMLYHKPNQQRKLRYVMFLGNASYDYKNRLENNTLFVPTFEFENSHSESGSHVSDDYFALLDIGEGYDNDGLYGVLDIGIGRVPAENVTEARRIVDKFIHYGSNKSRTKGAWKNEICLVADDESDNDFVNYAENIIYKLFKAESPNYNISKIYLDAFKQIRTNGGQRYPQVNDAIKAKIENGLFMFNYIGHGGVMSLADERVFNRPEIDAFKNYDALTFFVISACEFSRYDDPTDITAGERLILNPNGGAIGLITTSRLAYASSSVALNKKAIKCLMTKDEHGEYPRLGDAIRVSKNMTAAGTYNILLLGDPALKLAYPDYEIETTEINGKDITLQADTLSSLEEVTVKGFVKDRNGNLVSDYNGIIFPRIYDKMYLAKTRGQDEGSTVMEFEMQDNVLYQGKVTVSNGQFEFKFRLPRDIDYSYGKGRISYYAKNNDIDATGFTNNLYIGGTSDNVSTDDAGPEIKLFFNNREFVDGDVVSTSPLFLADLYDESGINTSGSGVGHDITAILDDNSELAYVLNDYYTTKLDTYKEGSVKFPFNDLEPGRHTIKLIAWDIYNNSAENTISFIVSNKIRPEITTLVGSPNPFNTSSGTDIVIEHNLFGEFIMATLSIYDLSGRLVRVLGPFDMRSDGFEIEPIHWDGKDNNGSAVKNGMYIYSARITDLKGYTSQKGGKLVKLF